MKKNTFLLPTLLTAVLFAALLVCMLVRTFQPAVILPALNIPNMVALCVATLLLEHFLSRNSARCYCCIALFGALAFGTLPLMAGFACYHDFWKYGLVGGVVFTATTFVFTSAVQRLQTGPKARLAAALTGLGIWLAAQCFAGILL